MKRSLRILLLLGLVFHLPTSVYAFDDDFDLNLDDDEVADIVNQLGDDLDGIVSTRSCDVQSAYSQLNSLLGLFGGEADFVEILKKSVYRMTNPIQSRYIGDMPAFIIYYDHKRFFAVEPFVNYMPRARFTKDCEALDSYLAVTDENIVREIKKVSGLFNAPTAAQALRLFAQFNLTEARAGAFCRWRHTCGNWTVAGQIPLYYYVRHYNATEDIRDDLKRYLSSFSGTEEPGQASGSTSKLKKLAVGDAWGLGNLTVDLVRHCYETDCKRLAVGVRSSLNLHAVFGRGLIGSNFQDQPIPVLDLEELMCNIDLWLTTPQDTRPLQAARNATKNWAVDVLNWASQSLLFPEMSEPISVGFFIEPQIKLNRQITIKSRFNADWIFPTRTERYLLATRDTSNFTEEYLTTAASISEEEASKRFSYMTELLQEKFAPNRSRIKLGSRKKFEWSIAAHVRFSNNLSSYLGYDFWWLDGDNIKSFKGDFTQDFDIKCPTGDCTVEQATILQPETLPVEVKKALRGSTYQSKIFGGIEYTQFRKCSDLTVGLAGDITVGRRWIGDDWTLKLAIGWQF